MEKWVILPNTNEHYEISTYGRLRNAHNKHLLKIRIKQTGYCEVCLAYGKKQYYLVHRLVAQTFIPNPNGYLYVNHKDEDKTNNKYDNLEWCTAKYNVNYGEGYFARYHKVIQKDLNGNVIQVWNSLKEASESLGIQYQSISAVCRGCRKTAANFIWEYV